MTHRNSEHLVQTVKERYGRIAAGESSSCCAPTCCGGTESASASSASVGLGYREGELAGIPKEADLGLGCGAPIEGLNLREGETVLDLGSGAGIDVFLAARQVGAKGRVLGVDMTPEMLGRARDNARRGGFTNVEFREGRLEALPIEDEAVDAVTSNCVINLVPDKAAVFREIHRVLKPGGRLVISDVVLDGRLPAALEQSILAYVGCVSGALQREDYFGVVRDSGLGEIEILKDVDFLAAGSELFVEEVRGKVRSVTFRATKPRQPV